MAATLVFYVLGAALGMATTGASLLTQPAGGVLMAVSAAGMAWAVLSWRPAKQHPVELNAAGTAGPVNEGA